MSDETILDVIADVRRAEPVSGEGVLGGPLIPAERPGVFHGAKVGFDLLVTDRRLVALRVTEEVRRRPGKGASRPGEEAPRPGKEAPQPGSARGRQARYVGADPALLVAAAPGSFVIGTSDVAEIIVDHTIENVGEYSSDAVLHVTVRSPAGSAVRFQAVNSGRRPDDVVALLAKPFGNRVRRAKVVRHGLLRRATRE